MAERSGDGPVSLQGNGGQHVVGQGQREGLHELDKYIYINIYRYGLIATDREFCNLDFPYLKEFLYIERLYLILLRAHALPLEGLAEGSAPAPSVELLCLAHAVPLRACSWGCFLACVVGTPVLQRAVPLPQPQNCTLYMP